MIKTDFLFLFFYRAIHFLSSTFQENNVVHFKYEIEENGTMSDKIYLKLSLKTVGVTGGKNISICLSETFSLDSLNGLEFRQKCKLSSYDPIEWGCMSRS